MAADTAPTVTAGSLRLYSRYISVLAEQLDAVADEDNLRIAELEEERLMIEADLDLPEGEGAESSLAELLGAALEILQEKVDMSRLLEERWEMLSTQALQSARSVGTPATIGGRYAEGRALQSQLDRRL